MAMAAVMHFALRSLRGGGEGGAEVKGRGRVRGKGKEVMEGEGRKRELKITGRKEERWRKREQKERR